LTKVRKFLIITSTMDSVEKTLFGHPVRCLQDNYNKCEKAVYAKTYYI
jgi:hypothetical protein